MLAISGDSVMLGSYDSVVWCGGSGGDGCLVVGMYGRPFLMLDF